MLDAVEEELDTGTLLMKLLGRVEEELDTGTLLMKLLGRVEEELDTGTLLMKLLGRAEDELDTDMLLTKLLVMDVLPDAVEVETMDEIADDNSVEELSYAELEIDVVGIGSAQVGAAIASPQARTAMDLLRPVCMVSGDRFFFQRDSIPG